MSEETRILLVNNLKPKDYMIITDNFRKLDKEIERLTNIINELEKWLEELNKPKNDMYGYHKQLGIKIDMVLDKLKELKENK